MNAIETLEATLAWLWRTSSQASVLVLLVLLVQWLLRNKLAPVWRYAIWFVVLVRLIVPMSPESAFSIFNYVKVGVVADQPNTDPNSQTVNPDFRVRDVNPSVLPDFTVSEITLLETVRADKQVRKQAVTLARGNRFSAFEPHLETARPALRQIAFAVWLLGVLVLGTRLIWGSLVFARRLNHLDAVCHIDVISLLDSCKHAMGVRRKVTLIETDNVESPALFGLIRLRLLLPSRMTAKFSQDELRYVFLHELAHIKRCDIIVNWLMSGLQIVHWFNPFIWYAFSRMRADRELACDALALAHTQHGENQSYGRTILKLWKNLPRPAARPGLVGILEDKNQIKRRIRMIAQFNRSPKWPLMTIILLVALGIVSLTDAQNDPIEEAGSVEPNRGKTATGVAQQKLTLVVVDSESGNPIKFAQATANFFRGYGNNETVRLRADSRGRCHLSLSGSPFSKLHVLFYADGYGPKGFVWPSDSVPATHTAKLARAHEFKQSHLFVRLPDGQPAVGAQVVRWAEEDGPDNLGKLQLKPTSETGQDGICFYRPDYHTGVAITHSKGYAHSTTEDLIKSPNVFTLRPWGRIEGTLRIGVSPGAGKKIAVRSLEAPSVVIWDTTETDSNGKFVFERLPAGKWRIGHLFSALNGERTTLGLSHIVSAEVYDGRSAQIQVGGGGHTLSGKVVAASLGKDIDWSVHARGLIQVDGPLSPLPPPHPFLVKGRRHFWASVSGVLMNNPFSSEDKRHYWTTPPYRRADPGSRRPYWALVNEQELARPRCFLEFDPDGGFRVNDVPPGEYNLIVELFEPISGSTQGTAMVSVFRAGPGYEPGDMSPEIQQLANRPDIFQRTKICELTKTLVVPELSEGLPGQPINLGRFELKSVK